MTAFCEEHGISRKSFYAIRARAREEGEVAAWQPRSRRPRISPNTTGQDVIVQALAVRQALDDEGWDNGPISVMDRMRRMGLHPPSRATLARIFRDQGVVVPQPKKKPRSAFRRFVRPAPNCLWQLDGTDWVLTRGRPCVILQLTDDHSRVAVASLAASGETSEAAIEVFDRGVAARGVPQELLTDNGGALNPIRRGYVGKLVKHVTRMGVTAITGRLGKPTTQGKNERAHQTLFKWLAKRPLADSLEELQEQLDRFDHLYNTERGHQELPDRMTPQQAWEATEVAPAPTPAVAPAMEQPPKHVSGEGARIVSSDGSFSLFGCRFRLTQDYFGTRLHVTWDLDEITAFDDQGTHLATFKRPPAGTRTVGNGRPRGFLANQQPSPMS